MKLVGANKAKILEETSTLFDVAASYSAMAQAHNPYGDGYACSRILKIIKEAFNAK